jgi:methionine-rich copper-binding protein CopC
MIVQATITAVMELTSSWLFLPVTAHTAVTEDSPAQEASQIPQFLRLHQANGISNKILELQRCADVARRGFERSSECNR